jgi:hypothetical protein
MSKMCACFLLVPFKKKEFGDFGKYDDYGPVGGFNARTPSPERRRSTLFTYLLKLGLERYRCGTSWFQERAQLSSQTAWKHPGLSEMLVWVTVLMKCRPSRRHNYTAS